MENFSTQIGFSTASCTIAALLLFTNLVCGSSLLQFQVSSCSRFRDRNNRLMTGGLNLQATRHVAALPDRRTGAPETGHCLDTHTQRQCTASKPQSRAGTFFFSPVFGLTISAMMAVHSHSSTALWMCSTHL